MSKNLFGIKGILQNLNIKSFIKMERFWLTIFFSVLIVVLCVFSRVNILKVLEIITSNALSAFPSLIGFSITGYALVLGFGDADILEDAILKKRNKLEEELDTFYIYLSSRMAIYILFFILAFILTYIINIIVKSGFKINIISPIYISLINYSILFFILFMIIFSFMLMMDIVYMIYNYSIVYIKQFAKKSQLKKNKEQLKEVIEALPATEQNKIADELNSDYYRKISSIKETIDKIDKDKDIQKLLEYINKYNI